MAGVANQFTAAAIGQLNIPLYQGGGEYALIRQSKETLGQQRLNLDLVRRQKRASVAQYGLRSRRQRGIAEGEGAGCRRRSGNERYLKEIG